VKFSCRLSILPAKTFIKILLVTLIYVVSGKLGLRFAFLHPSATPVWPPAGIMLALLLLWGYELWPGILLGAFLVNLTTTGHVLISLGIAAGHTLENVLGAYGVNRFARGTKAFEKPQDIFKFALLAGFASPLVSATIGVTSLSVGGLAPWHQLGWIWLTWWLGDMSGVLILAPFLLLWSVPYQRRWSWAQLPELGLLTSALIVGSWVVYRYPLDYLCIPLVVWAAFRFGEREAASATLLISGIAIWGTLHGYGSFVRRSPNESILLLQTFVTIVSLTGLMLATIETQQQELEAAERARVQQALRASEKRYEQLLRSNIIGTMVVDWDGRVFDANDAFLTMLGYSRQDLADGRVGGPSMTPQEYHSLDEWARTKIRESGVCPPLEKEYFRKDGSRIPVLVGVVLHEEPEHRLVCLVVDASERRKAMDALRSAYDELETRVDQRTKELATANRELNREIDRRRRAEAALQSLATTDPLTGLYNRRGFNTLAQQLLKQARRARRSFLIFVVDLDGLKQINDTYGHLEGDQAVNATAMILKDTFRASDVVARFGGDEFAVAVIEDDSESGNQPYLTRLQEKLQEFNDHSHKSYQLSLSVGTAKLEPDDLQSLDSVIERADKALYEEKRTKKSKALEDLPPQNPPVV
jgi:diguanylate cyclase (GGDEF)-like protein/PAS domain S-box-containing protein